MGKRWASDLLEKISKFQTTILSYRMPKIGGKRKAAADKHEATKCGETFPEQRLPDVYSSLSNTSDLTYQPLQQDEVDDVDTDDGPMQPETLRQSSSANSEIVSDIFLLLWEYHLTYVRRGKIASGDVK